MDRKGTDSTDRCKEGDKPKTEKDQLRKRGEKVSKGKHPPRERRGKRKMGRKGTDSEVNFSKTIIILGRKFGTSTRLQEIG